MYSMLYLCETNDKNKNKNIYWIDHWERALKDRANECGSEWLKQQQNREERIFWNWNKKNQIKFEFAEF